MWLKPIMSEEAIVELAREGMRKFKPGAQLYIRPMYWAEQGGATSVQPDPESTRFCLSIYEPRCRNRLACRSPARPT